VLEWLVGVAVMYAGVRGAINFINWIHPHDDHHGSKDHNGSKGEEGADSPRWREVDRIAARLGARVAAMDESGRVPPAGSVTEHGAAALDPRARVRVLRAALRAAVQWPIEPGSHALPIVAVTGPLGAGKTALVRAAAQLSSAATPGPPGSAGTESGSEVKPVEPALRTMWVSLAPPRSKAVHTTSTGSRGSGSS